MAILRNTFQNAEEQVKNPRIFVSWYGNRTVPANALKVQISTSCPAGMKDDMDVFFRSLYPDYNTMVKAHKDGQIDDREYVRRYVSSVITPNKDTILKNIGKLKEMAAEKGGDIYLFCWCGLGKFCHRYIVRDFLRKNVIECSEPEADLQRYPGGEYIIPEIGETLSSGEVVKEKGWAQFASNGYEVSSRGDSRFSAFYARFAQGTLFAGHDVSGKSVEEVYQVIVKGYPNIDSGKGRGPCRWSPLNVIYRGYATDDKEEASDLRRTVSGTASDYLEGIDAKYHFTTDRWEAEGYAKVHADSSEELTGQRNRHYSGAIPHVSAYILKPGVPFVMFEDIHDFNRHPERVGDVALVILKQGTLSTGVSEFVLRDGMKTCVKKLDVMPTRDELREVSYSWYKKIWELWASQNKSLMDELDRLSEGKILTDMFGSGNVTQARALSEILNERRVRRHSLHQSDPKSKINSIKRY